MAGYFFGDGIFFPKGASSLANALRGAFGISFARSCPYTLTADVISAPAKKKIYEVLLSALQINSPLFEKRFWERILWRAIILFPRVWTVVLTLTAD